MRRYCSRPTSYLHEIVVGPRVWFEVKLGQLVSAQPGQHAIEDVIVSFTFELKSDASKKFNWQCMQVVQTCMIPDRPALTSPADIAEC